MSVDGKAAEYRSTRVGFSPRLHSEFAWSNDRMKLLMELFPLRVALMIHSDELEEQLASAQEEADMQDAKLTALLEEHAPVMKECIRHHLAVNIPTSDGENMFIDIMTQDYDKINDAIEYRDEVLGWAKRWMYELRAATKGLDQAEWKMRQIRWTLGLADLD